jgi:hypoxanthine phosphoribosyltransferase
MKILISSEQIHQRIKQLGEQINLDYKDKQIVVIGILKGCFVFMADLIRTIERPLESEFIQASSYGNSTVSSGVVKFLFPENLILKNKHVILLDDIIDTGLTLNEIISEIKLREPASLKICSLLVKNRNREFTHNIDYVGFEIEDSFVVGYGLDYNGLYRNLPHLAIYEQ